MTDGEEAIDFQQGLRTLLDSYGCSATDAGWRLLAIRLAIEAGKLPQTPRFAPELRIENLPDLMLVEMERAAGAPTNREAARRASGRTKGLRGEPESIRVMASNARTQIRQAQDRGKLPAGKILALTAARLAPTQDGGQAIYDRRYQTALERSAASLARDWSGDYHFDEPVAASPGVRLVGIRVRQRSETARRGFPRDRARAPVKLLAALEWGPGRWIEDEVLPDVCEVHHGQLWFSGVASGVKVTFDGSVSEADPPHIGGALHLSPSAGADRTVALPLITRVTN